MKHRYYLVVLGLLVGVTAACSPPPVAPGSSTGNPRTAATPAPVQLPPGVDVAADRIGIKPLLPAVPVDQPNVALDPSQVAPALNRTAPANVEINLTIKEVRAEIADGATYTFWTFGGTVPGPMLRVMKGDTVKLTLTNPANSTASHNIDLHAVNGPGGGAAVTSVAPGETKSFTFQALNAGAYVYHCAFAPPYYHIAQGMYGGIVVEPKGGLPKVDREFYVMQGDWYTTGKQGDQGNQEFSSAKAEAEQPEYFTMNGRIDALTKLFPLKAKVGETIRLFFGDGGPNIGSNFHIIGEIFDKVYSGSPDTPVKNEETYYVPPGSVSTFELKLDEPGQYLLVDHALWRVAKGAAGILQVEGAWNDAIYSPPAGSGGH